MGQVIPSFDYYLGFLLAGLIAAIAILLDAQALYILAVLFTPFLGPLFGLPLSLFMKSGKLFLNSIVNIALGGTIIFGFGTLAGWLAGNISPAKIYNQVNLHNTFSWPDLIVIVIGSGISTYLLARSPRQKPLVSNIALSYGLILPLAVSGFSLTSGITGEWTGGLTVFFSHLAIAVGISTLLMILLGLKPVSVFVLGMSTVFIFVGAAMIIFVSGTGITPKTPEPLPTVVPQPTAAATEVIPQEEIATPQPELSTQQPLISSTPTLTLVPSSTPTPTVTFAPTPIWAKVDAPTGGGAFLREEPDGKIMTSLLNGSPVIVISEPLRVEGGIIWVKIRTEDGVVGWIVQSLLATATPSPGW